MIELLDLGISLTQMFLSKLGNKVPSELVALGQAFVDAAIAHKADLITKAALEANRG